VLPGREKGKRKVRANGGESSQAASAEKKQRRLNLETFKWHNLGHLPAAIRRFGTSDGFSTQIVRVYYIYKLLIADGSSLSCAQGELEHRRAKRFYPRTDKKNHMGQIAQHTRRERILESIHRRELQLREKERRARIARKDGLKTPPSPQQGPSCRCKRGRPSKKNIMAQFRQPLPPNIHHQLSDSDCDYFNILQFVHDHRDDRAVTVSTYSLLG
jgi:hypothetical protein